MPPLESEQSAILRVDPAGIEIEVRPGETLLQAAWRAGYHWPTLCYGLGNCTACQCEIVAGQHLTSPRTEAEEQLLADLNKRVRRANPRRIRLACQLKITGDVTVRKPGVKVVDEQPLLSISANEENVNAPDKG